MAEFAAAAIGAGVALGTATYTTAVGFVARHESVHSLQLAETRRHIMLFEAAREEITEEGWEVFLTIRAEAQQKESEYEESIAAYKETLAFRFVTKWNKKRQVRQKKKALQKANRSLRLHYYDSTSDAYTSSITAVSGDADDEHILCWAEGVSVTNSDDLDAVPYSTALNEIPLSGRVPAKGRFEAEQHHLDKLCEEVHHLHTDYTFDTAGLSGPLNEVEQERCGLTT